MADSEINIESYRSSIRYQLAEMGADSNGILPEEGRTDNLKKILYSLLNTFDKEEILQLIPNKCGCSDEEFDSLIDFCKKNPLYLDWKKAKEYFDEQKIEKIKEWIGWDEFEFFEKINLPIGLKESVEMGKDNQRMALLCTALTMCGFYGTGVQFIYLNKEIRKLNLGVFIVGNTGSGKNKASELYDLWMKPYWCYLRVRKDGKEENADMGDDEYEGSRKKKSVKYKHPMLEVGEKASAPKLAQLMKLSGGRHLIGFTAEASEGLRSKDDSSFLNLDDIKKKAFDNGRYIQTYKTETVSVGVNYNYIMQGTPDVLKKMYDRNKIEDGLFGRLLLVYLPTDQTKLEESSYNFSFEDIFMNFKYHSEGVLKAASIMHCISGKFLDRRTVGYNAERLFESQKRMLKYFAEWSNDMQDLLKKYDLGGIFESIKNRCCVMGCVAATICHILENRNYFNERIFIKSPLDDAAQYEENQYIDWLGEVESKPMKDISDNAIEFGLGIAKMNLTNKLECFFDDMKNVESGKLTKILDNKIKPRSYWAKVVLKYQKEVDAKTFSYNELMNMYKSIGGASRSFSQRLSEGIRNGYI